MNFKSIGEFDNFIVACTEREDFEKIMKHDFFLLNKALQMNFINNPLVPKDLLNDLYEKTTFNDIKKMMEKKGFLDGREHL